jgi:predicted PurR-regulated permease PerM
MKPPQIFRMVFAIILIAAIGIFLLYALRPFIGALFGAVVFFFLFSPLQHYFVDKRKFSPVAAAITIIVLSIVVVIVPLMLLMNTLFFEITRLAQSPDVLESFISDVAAVVERFGLEANLDRWVDELVLWLRGLLAAAIKQVSQGLISFMILYFTFYYLLIHADKVRPTFIELNPFSKKHAGQLYDEVRLVTNATLLTAGVIAILQAIALTVTFLLFSIPGAFFWGAIAAIFSFLPLVGVTLIYLVFGIGYLLTGSAGIGIVLIIAGLFFGNADNFVRGPLTRRFGKLHPLVTIIGLFIGVPTFGLVGIVIGPLLLSYFLLMLKMFKEEFAIGKN